MSRNFDNSNYKGRLIRQLIVPVAMVVLFFAGLQTIAASFFLTTLKSELKSGIKKEFTQTEDNVCNILKGQGRQVLFHNTEAVLHSQLQYLETMRSRFSSAEELIEFCLKDNHFQKLALKPFGRYGYTNVSIKSGEKLICVAHPKKELMGRDLFEVVKNLNEDARSLQNVEEFIKHWTIQISGSIEFEQTEAFLPAHIPESAGRRKIAHQIWAETAGIPYVAETTTYLAEFLEPVDTILLKHGQAVESLESKIITGMDFWVRISLAIVIISLLIVFAVAAYFNHRLIKIPLENIYEGIQRFSKRKFDEPIKCEVNNELQAVAEVSNSMAKELNRTLGYLEDSRKQLEEKVEARTADLAKANAELEVKSLQAERLLRNTLPDSIARRLRAGEEIIVDDFALATVIFTDFKGFTQLTEKVTPDKLVMSLNEVFAQFDEYARELGIEKIKTIGDAYMAVGGVPERDERHPQKVVEFGLRMRDYIARRQKDKDSLPFQIRIGIHSGPVLAGVIGKSKFSYDLWGDTVNIASRCESSSETMKVNISESTYKLVKDYFSFEPRGLIAAKGKGEMPMYFVERSV